MDTNNQNPASTFVAIDVEWATRDHQICQIGMAVVRNGEIVERPQWLIQPPGNNYDETLYGNHFIRPEMTAEAPTLEEAWCEIQPYLLMGELWAHNAASAEVPALQKSLAEYGIPCDWLSIRDSKELFQRQDCKGGNGLEQCAIAMNVPFDKDAHHDALYDAEILAKILVRYQEGCCPEWGGVPANAEELRKSKQDKKVLHLGEFTEYYTAHPSGEEDVFAVLGSTCEGSIEQVVDVFDKGDKMPGLNQGKVDFTKLNKNTDNPINGKTVVITGAFLVGRDSLKDALKVMGAKPTSSISGKTYAIIVGTKNVGPNKLVDIEEQEAKGHHIFRIVGDTDLDALLYGDGNKFFNR